MLGFFIVLYVLGFIFLTGWLAGQKGRGPGRWALLGLVFGPLALLALIGAPPKVS